MANLANVLKAANMNRGNAVVISDEDLLLIQKRLLAVLDDIIDVCEEQKICYQMSGGSALGTIRHQGFIPWDDDIDINMQRKEIGRAHV